MRSFKLYFDESLICRVGYNKCGDVFGWFYRVFSLSVFDVMYLFIIFFMLKMINYDV